MAFWLRWKVTTGGGANPGGTFPIDGQFAVFIPTDYLGVAELGLISAMGMLIILFLTLTLFPARCAG